ncbi:MAG TPA: YbhB/YbcL family Raf kinase inhibitor-like protein [Candidatus Thermoplasmatota archaeon]
MRRLTSILIVLAFAGCVGGNEDPASTTTSSSSTTKAPDGPFGISSSVFSHMGDIPRRHTCDDANVSPPLTFANVPANASTLALIMEDPDAPSGTINHWTFWNLPTTKTGLPEAVNIANEGGREGNNYGGPCPPDGEHRYFFYAYAVDSELALAAGAGVPEMRQALEGHVVEEAEMYGLYCRPNVPPLPCADPV